MLLVAAAGGGAFYYFKILKPKKDAAKGSSSLDDLDFDEDDEETEVCLLYTSLRRVKGFFLRAFCCVSLNLCADMLHNLFRCRPCGG